MGTDKQPVLETKARALHHPKDGKLFENYVLLEDLKKFVDFFQHDPEGLKKALDHEIGLRT